MKYALYAALASLALLAAPAYADSERYPEGNSVTVNSGSALNDTGSEGYFVAGANNAETRSNVVAMDTGSEHMPVFAGQAAISIGAKSVAGR